MQTDRQSDLEWARARDVRAQSDRFSRQALFARERTELPASGLVDTLRQATGRPLGDRGDAFSLRLARLPQSVALARHEFRRWLDRSGVARDDALDITLAFSEACANAVEHPGRLGPLAFEMEARREGGELLVTVRDFGTWTAADAASTRGRGIAMIRKIMDAVEIEAGGGGTEITMRRSLRP